MAFTASQLQQLFDERAQEGQYLEFKRGAALVPTNGARQELVKDCTGFANANGGTIVYGVAEETIDGVQIAAALSPVATPGVGGDWITNILRSNSSPPLGRFDVVELPVEGGRVIVVEIEAASTAHQNLLDRKYYQRAGRNTEAMIDFQIRDVMNRRLRPEIQVDHRLINIESTGDLHRKSLRVLIRNVGQVTLEKWRFEIDLPAEVIRDSRNPTAPPLLEALLDGWFDAASITGNADGRRVLHMAFCDPDEEQRRRYLHPGQALVLLDPEKPPNIVVEVDHGIWRQIRDMPILWRMYLPNAQPIEGRWEFDTWCNF